ncbi:uncharacterized protein LOC129918121 [Episyrphus balteatus]|uniref:uncharacterized protein LOC129918121 n=1 Tax=Episyrphus balteatus TaxID=286459 RepID=UPI0024855978|nr:uncharacterized protein LOC129918121 [Episyrphus balteatus]
MTRFNPSYTSFNLILNIVSVMHLPATILAAFFVVLVAELFTTEASFYSKFLKFIEDVIKIEQFESVFLLKSSKESSFDDHFIAELTTSLGTPVILSTETSSFYLSGDFNENILTIVQFDSTDLLLQKLSEYLQHLRFCKTIFVLKSSSRNDFELKRVFTFCWKYRMVNVIAVFQDFWNSSTFYSYRNFGDLTIEEFTWSKKDIVIFPDRLQDLEGIRFPVLFEPADSGIIIKVNSKGETIYGGLMGNIFSSLAKKINARLHKSNVNTSFLRKTHEGVMNGTIEMSGRSLVFSSDDIKWYTYPIVVFDWSVMLPVESNIPIYKVFAFVFNWDSFVITIMGLILLSLSLAASNRFSGSIFNFFFNIDCFRGMLGQGFTETPQASCSTKIIYSMIFVLGILMVTTYNAFLQSLMTTPPGEKVIKSFDDLQASGLKIYINIAEIKELSILRPDLMEKYSNLFQVESNSSVLKELRNSLNTDCAFIVTGMSWMNYENQQNFFNQKLFRWSEELCFVKNRLIEVIINENSIYKKLLNLHILETQSSGLLDFWMKKSFYELLAAGKVKRLKFGLDELEQLKVEDLKWFWISTALALMIAVLCFVGEICVLKWKKWRTKNHT